MSRSESPAIAAAKAARQEQVSKQADTELKKQGAINDDGQIINDRKRSAEDILQEIDNLHSEIAEMDAFVNDPANVAVLEASPDLAAQLEEKKRRLSSIEARTDKTLQSPVPADREVGTEMRKQYLDKYSESYAPPLKRMRVKSDTYSAETGYYKSVLDVGSFLESVGSGRHGWVNETGRSGASVESTDTKYNNDIDSLHEELRTAGLESNAIVKEVLKKKSQVIEGGLKEIREGYPRFEADYKLWKSLYEEIRFVAGMPPASDIRTDESIQYKDQHFGFNTSSLEGIRNEIRYNTATDELKKTIEAVKKVKETGGILGFGKLGRKKAQLETFLGQFSGSERAEMAAKFDQTSPETIDASAEAVTSECAEKITDKEKWRKILQHIESKYDSIDAINKRTPLAVMWGVEKANYLLAKMSQADTSQPS